VRHATALLGASVLLASAVCLWNRSEDLAQAVRESDNHLTRMEKADLNRRLYLAEVDEAAACLDGEPGLAVARIRPVAGGDFEITVLKDPMARDPEMILAREGNGPKGIFRIRTRPFLSADPAMTLYRAEQLLSLPPGTRAAFDAETGLLTLSGEAPLGWIQEALRMAPFVPGVLRVASDGLRDPREAKAAALLDQADGLVLHFPDGSRDTSDRDILAAATGSLKALARLAVEMETTLNVYVYARPDRGQEAPESPGASEASEAGRLLAVDRAEGVARTLAQAGVLADFKAFGSYGGPFAGPGPGVRAASAAGLAVLRARLGDGRGLHAPDSGCPYPGPWGAPECPEKPDPPAVRGPHTDGADPGSGSADADMNP
jgi:hypothetical protein